MRPRSLRDYLILSWIVPMLCAVAGSALLSAGISYLDYANYRDASLQRMHQAAPIIARRLAAELLLGRNGRTSAVIDDLKSEFHLLDLQLAPESSPQDVVAVRELRIREIIPGVTPATSVWMVSSSKSYFEFLNPRNFLFALVPIFGLVFLGFCLQRRLLNRYVIFPVQALAETSTGNRSVNPNWPTEIQRISNELAESFSNREQAIFGQLTRGIIHDIRTYLNSIHTATQLVNESAVESEKRGTLLEKLASACTRNLPKIQELVTTSLDSSRQIPVTPQLQNIEATIRQSIGNLASIADLKKVKINTSLATYNIAHDRVQMERVLTNLIKNAIEASEETTRGQREVFISANSDPGRAIQVIVEDNGPGIQRPDNIFRPLKTTKVHGHGLGLFLSKKIIDAHNGQITVGHSARLGGAQFTITLPNEEVRS